MRSLCCVVLAAVIFLGGCVRDMGTGGTGELVIPTRRFREIDAVEMSALSTMPPTTAPATQPAGPPAAQVSLTLAEARQAALSNNLDLAVQLLNPVIARQFVSQEQAAFESVFTAGAAYASLDSPAASELSSNQATSVDASAGVRIPLRTGGALDFSVPISRQSTDNQFATLNPAYTSDVAASISLPLFRGAGVDVNANPIRIAFYQYQQSEARTRLEVTRVLAEVDRAYWRLYAARRALEVRKKEYDLAVAQFERAQRQVKVGQSAEVEVIRAESGVADRIEGIILAENQVRDRQRELKRIVNQPDLTLETPTIVLPASDPSALHYTLDERALVQLALDRRMEMLELELQIAADAANVRVARNATLPLVALEYQYNINGLGSSLGDSVEMTGRHDYEDHRIGLRIEVPLGNESARAQLRQAMARRLQTLRTRDARAAQIQQEVLNAADQLEANFQRILAAQKRVILAARTLDAEIRQFGQGLRTSTDVLIAQANLANAQLSEIAAVTEYQIAQVDIAYATGTILGAAKVIWQPADAPEK